MKKQKHTTRPTAGDLADAAFDEIQSAQRDLDELRQAGREAVAAARIGDEAGAAKLDQAIDRIQRNAAHYGSVELVGDILAYLPATEPARTPEGAALRKRVWNRCAFFRRWDIPRRAAIERFKAETPTIYIENDRDRLPDVCAFDNVVAAARALGVNRFKVAGVDPYWREKRGILVWGESGCGKTRALYAAARELMRYESSGRIRVVTPGAIKGASVKRSDWTDLFEDLTNADILLVDDMSHTRFSEAYAANLLELVEFLTANEFAPRLLVSVQCSGRDLVRKWVGSDGDLRPTAEAIARRLGEFLVALEFNKPAKRTLTKTNDANSRIHTCAGRLV